MLDICTTRAPLVRKYNLACCHGCTSCRYLTCGGDSGEMVVVAVATVAVVIVDAVVVVAVLI